MQKTATSPIATTHESDASVSATQKLRDELEMVAYVTSHDLKAPLRIIQSCCEELNIHPALVADGQGRDTVHMLHQEAARMKTLMEGLLDYIRLETFVPKHALLDSSEVVTTALATLEEEIKTTDAEITTDVMPQVMGHRGRLTRLFAHLLGNALKFHGKQRPKIHISTQRQGKMWEFCIEDNGIGIDEEYHDIIFRLFQRLHISESYPGNGIGLALAQKIVEAHGGKLWIQSAPEKGSRFYSRYQLPRLEESMSLAKIAEVENISVLLIEDSPGDAAAFTKAMMFGESLYNFYVMHKMSLAEGLGCLQTLPADVILLDLNLPDAKDIKAIEEVHRLFPDVPMVVISGYSDMDIVHRALRSGVQEFLIKGECSGMAIRQSIYQAIVRKKIERSYQCGDKL